MGQHVYFVLIAAPRQLPGYQAVDAAESRRTDRALHRIADINAV